MAVVKKSAVGAPVLPKQTVEVEALGGEVVVRGLLLVELLAVQDKIATLHKAHQAKAGAEASAIGVSAIVPLVLATCVLDADGAQLFSEHEWDIFGARHQGQALALFNAAWRLSGMDQAATAKN